MNKIISFVLVALLFTPSLCKADHWVRKADFPGAARRSAYYFAIGNKAYIGGGSDNLTHNDLNDFWEYDPSLDTWTQKSNLPFSTVTSILPLGFAIGNYGYIFLDSANQFWQYAPMTDSWVRKADLPGSRRVTPSYFVIGSIGYVCGGFLWNLDILDSSLYRYDPATNLWASLTNAPHSFSSSGNANGFTANNKGYITGIIRNSMVLEYNPIFNLWSQKANFPGLPRSDASSFNIGNIGYFGVGDTGTGGVFKDWWQYNAYNDSWIQKDSIPCTDGKDEDPSFVVNNKGYICFGNDITTNSEVWEYTPDSVTEINELPTQVRIDLYPNPTTLELTITSTNPITCITITNLIGQTMYSNKYNSPIVHIDVADLPAGIYLVMINGIVVQKIKKQ